jgi:hypothetical protein
MTKDEDDESNNGRDQYDSEPGFGRQLDPDDTGAIFLIEGCLTHLRGISASGESLTVNFSRLSDDGKRRVLERAADLFREAADTLHDAGRVASAMIRQMDIRDRERGGT